MIKPLSKIIQIIPGVGRQEAHGKNGYRYHFLTALCEDGSVWEKNFHHERGTQWVMVVPSWAGKHDLPDLNHSGWESCNRDLCDAIGLTKEAISCMICGDHARQVHLLDQVKDLVNGVIVKTGKIKQDPDAFRGSAGM